MGELQRQAEKDLVKEMHTEATLHTCPGRRCQGKREQAEKDVPDRLYDSIDAAKVRIEPRAKQGKRSKWQKIGVI